MKKHTLTWVASLALLLVLTLNTATRPAAAAKPVAAKPVAAMPVAANLGNTYHYGFEQDVKPWFPMTDNGTPDFVMERLTGSNGCPDMIGNSFARLKLSANPKPPNDVPLPVGGWTVTGFPASFMNSVTVEWSARSPKACESCVPMVYVGDTEPTRITQFQPMKAPLKDGWQSYKFQSAVYVHGQEGAVYVAIGWTNLSGALDLDCINIDILPLDGSAAGN